MTKNKDFHIKNSAKTAVFARPHPVSNMMFRSQSVLNLEVFMSLKFGKSIPVSAALISVGGQHDA